MPNKDPRNTEGAGNAGRWPSPWPACRKKAGGSHHRSSRTSGIPCAMGLRLIRDLPGERAFLPPSSARSEASVRELSASVAAPGPHDFNVREEPRAITTSANRRSACTRPVDVARRDDIVAATASRPACRDDRAYAPPIEAGCADKTTDLGVESRGFLQIGNRFRRRSAQPEMHGPQQKISHEQVGADKNRQRQ